ncbi:MAG: SDR family NAD(P)-dependent oxidoreductase [Chlamydiia bacterium]|nr:SDR family NAD(P)-dependent oxidoreductase [Chlamydiia bacterium]
MSTLQWLREKTLLITGGTGSFGRWMTRTLVERNLCRKIIVFSRDEFKQWEMRTHDPLLKSDKIRYFLGDIRDEHRLKLALREVDIVIHTAALKQVPAAEYNPDEFIKTNIQGTSNLIHAALESNVERVLALSTDKAVNPFNLYGTTKLCAEKLLTAANSYTGQRAQPRFSILRYGNVLGSRGSLILKWKHCKRHGLPLPLTDRRMTRLWLTLDHAVEHVFRALTHMRGGEVFVPKSASLSLLEMAEILFPGHPIEEIGARPGEKLHETLLGADEASHSIDADDTFLILPQGKPAKWQLYPPNFGKPLERGFTYTSDTCERAFDGDLLRHWASKMSHV